MDGVGWIFGCCGWCVCVFFLCCFVLCLGVVFGVGVVFGDVVFVVVVICVD